MNGQGLEDLSREDLLKIMARDRFVKEQMSARFGALMLENTELIGLVQELQQAQQPVAPAPAEPVVEPPAE